MSAIMRHGGEMLDDAAHWLELGAAAIEALAVLVIAVGFVWSLCRYFMEFRNATREEGFGKLRVELGLALLLGLELLVVADVIDTITTEATLHSLATLAFLVVVRTMLSWSLTLQVEGRWPWQPEETPDDA